VVLGATLPGERERPCELITPPIETNHLDRLEALLGLARSLDFTVPAEGAIHLHFDGAPLCDASTVANLVRVLGVHSDALKERMGTNPRCRRLGAWPPALLELISSPGFARLKWPDARKQLRKLKLTKYVDFNIRNLIHEVPGKHTFEVRILPVWMDGRKILDAAALFAAIIHWARDGKKRLKPVPSNLDEVLEEASVTKGKRRKKPAGSST
jgi:hypothetical protein